MIANDMSIPATRASDERRALVVALLRDVVMGSEAAGDAGEGELVVRRFQLRSLALAGGFLG